MTLIKAQQHFSGITRTQIGYYFGTSYNRPIGKTHQTNERIFGQDARGVRLPEEVEQLGEAAQLRSHLESIFKGC